MRTNNDAQYERRNKENQAITKFQQQLRQDQVDLDRLRQKQIEQNNGRRQHGQRMVQKEKERAESKGKLDAQRQVKDRQKFSLAKHQQDELIDIKRRKVQMMREQKKEKQALKAANQSPSPEKHASQKDQFKYENGVRIHPNKNLAMVLEIEEYTQNRDRKQIWMLDLQQEFDKIYDSIESVLSVKAREQAQMTKEDQQNFLNQIEQQINFSSDKIRKIKAMDDDYAKIKENSLILQNFTRTFQSLRDLLLRLYQIESDIKEYQNQKSAEKISVRSATLLQEIQFSTRRVQRLKAGNRLDQVLGEQLVQLGLDQNVGHDQSSIMHQQDNQQDQREDEIHQLLDNFDQKDTQPHFITEQPLIIKQSEDIDDLITKFQNHYQTQTMKIAKMMQEYIIIHKDKIDFQEKYKNLHIYFQEKFGLSSLFLGEKVIENYINKNEELDLESKNLNQKQEKQNEDQDLYQDLIDKQNFTQAEQKDVFSINKVMKINQEIRNQLLQHEHGERMKMIEAVHIESNQNYWNNIMEKPNQQQNDAPSYINRRPLVFRQKSNDHLQLESLGSVGGGGRQDDGVSSTINLQTKKRTLVTEDILSPAFFPKNVYLNAHPQNPLISIAFGITPENQNVQSIDENKLKFSIMKSPNSDYVPPSTAHSSTQNKFAPGLTTSTFLNPNSHIERDNIQSEMGPRSVPMRMLRDTTNNEVMADELRQSYSSNLFRKDARIDEKQIIYPRSVNKNHEKEGLNDLDDGNKDKLIVPRAYSSANAIRPEWDNFFDDFNSKPMYLKQFSSQNYALKVQPIQPQKLTLPQQLQQPKNPVKSGGGDNEPFEISGSKTSHNFGRNLFDNNEVTSNFRSPQDNILSRLHGSNWFNKF